jgi:hypothetical protein
MFIFDFFGGLFAYKMIRYFIAFLLGCVLGATGLHALLAGMWHEILIIFPVHLHR